MMAKETEPTWTVNTLKLYFEQRFADNEKAVQAAFLAAKDAVSAALMSAEKAVDKAEQSQLRVNESQNEFRGTLKDQASQLMPRSEAESLIREMNTKIDDLRTSRDTSGGKSAGMTMSVGLLFSAIAAFGTIIGMIVVLSHVLS
jgi:hypothetical protein